MAAQKASPDEFLQSFLLNPATSIPKGAQWIVSFESLASLLPAITKAHEYEPSGSWKTEQAANIVLSETFQGSKGCMFCQAIGLPGEGTDAVVEGNIKSNNFLRSYVGAGRTDMPIMRMTFLDTNVSFSDSFLRSWSLATATFGLLARNDIKYRTNLDCYKFAITPKGPFTIQHMRFYDICCISVSEEEYQYTPPSSPVLREARFVYNHYSIDTVTNNSPDFKIKTGLDILRARGRD